MSAGASETLRQLTLAAVASTSDPLLRQAYRDAGDLVQGQLDKLDAVLALCDESEDELHSGKSLGILTSEQVREAATQGVS